MFFSSRTFPGHAYSESSVIVAGEIAGVVDVVLPAELIEEEVQERGNVLATFAQRRHADVDDVEPIVEIFAERLRCHAVDEVAIRRRDHPHIDARLNRRRSRRAESRRLRETAAAVPACAGSSRRLRP